MLEAFTGIVMLIVAYSYFREGLLTSLTTLVNVVVSGLIAFDLFEPLAEQIQPMLTGTFLEGFEDAFAMFFLFIVPLAGLRWLMNTLASQDPEMHALAQQCGASAVGLLTGYLLAGFLICMLQTFPWGEHFLGFNSQVDKEPSARRLLPPDRVWLAMMQRASAGPLSDASPFDPEGTFELRYAKLRRTKEDAGGKQ